MVLCICILPVNSESSPPHMVMNQEVIFFGQIPAGDGNVSIRTSTGAMHTVPAMSPIGIIQALAGTDIIQSYEIGDCLLNKRGIFILDGINSYKVAGRESWVTTVNGVQLREYLIPYEEGLNTYRLKPGDDVIFSYGDPKNPISSSRAIIRVLVGGDIINLPMFAQQPVLVSTSSSDETNNETAFSQSMPEPDEQISTDETTENPEDSITNTTDSSEEDRGRDLVDNQTNTSEIKLPDISQIKSTKIIKDIEDEENLTLESDLDIVINEKNFEIVTGFKDELTDISESADEVLAEDVIEDSSNQTDNRIIYAGPLQLPSADITVNITAENGLEYTVPTHSPIGILDALQQQQKISSYCISDRGMKKGGILILEGVNEFFYNGTKTWFVKINGRLLEDYFDPDTFGLNIIQAITGDTVSYYYGDPSLPVSSAESVIIVTIE